MVRLKSISITRLHYFVARRRKLISATSRSTLKIVLNVASGSARGHRIVRETGSSDWILRRESVAGTIVKKKIVPSDRSRLFLRLKLDDLRGTISRMRFASFARYVSSIFCHLAARTRSAKFLRRAQLRVSRERLTRVERSARDARVPVILATLHSPFHNRGDLRFPR